MARCSAATGAVVTNVSLGSTSTLESLTVTAAGGSISGFAIGKNGSAAILTITGDVVVGGSAGGQVSATAIWNTHSV